MTGAYPHAADVVGAVKAITTALRAELCLLLCLGYHSGGLIGLKGGDIFWAYAPENLKEINHFSSLLNIGPVHVTLGPEIVK